MIGEATMNTEVMRWASEGSDAGKLRFPEIVMALTEASVESYSADLVRGEKTYYTPDGDTHTVKSTLPHSPIANDFSGAGIIAAIRGARADTIRYPEFVRQARAAGIVAYWVFLTGRRAVYLGRMGEIHIEEFPSR